MPRHSTLCNRLPQLRRASLWMLALTCAALCLLAAPSPAIADSIIVFVKPAATGTGTGDSWENATTLQSALTNAASGHEIWVATGVYIPGVSVTSSFVLTDDVILLGGFAATETERDQRDWQANPTVLSGDIDSNDTTDANGVVTDVANIVGTNALHVVTSSGVSVTSTLDGFFITAGSAIAPFENPCADQCGGGIFNDGGSPTLANLAISGNRAGREGGGMFNRGSSPTLNNVTFSGNSASLGGGIFNVGGSPTLTDVTFISNIASNIGGGMNNTGSNPTLTAVTFISNTASTSGGGMINNVSNPTLIDVIFSGNSAGSGGGISNGSSSPTLTDVTFSGNTASSNGGGMNNTGSNPTLTDVSFISNIADSDGGGMYNTGSNPTLTDVSFISNTADRDGGGMYNAVNSSPTLTDVTFSGNEAVITGGGIYNDDSSPTLTDITFSGNRADVEGGGIYNDDSSPTLTDVTFSGNTADSGGGMANENSSSPTLINVSFISNTADSGGGISNDFSSPTLTNVTFSGNTADSDGGGMFNDDSSPTLTNVTFSGNTAQANGGGMVIIDSTATLTNVTFSGNKAAIFSGGGMAIDSSAVKLTNVLFSGNSASAGDGGGIANDNSSPTLTNVTFSGNTASFNGGGIFNTNNSDPLLQNTILWANQAGSNGPNIHNDAAADTPTIRFSLVQGGLPNFSIDGGNNRDDDPLFVRLVDCGANGCGDDPATANFDESANDDYGDLSLLPASPAIDVGDNEADLDGSGLLTATISSVISDVAGGPRIVAVRVVTPTVDLGAYEAANTPPLFQSSPPLNATQDVAYTYNISTTDPNGLSGSELTLTAQVKPPWLTFTDNGDGTATLSGTPANADVGNHPVTLRVQETLGGTTEQLFTINVADVNEAPSFTSTPVTAATQGTPFAYAVTTTDPDPVDSRAITAVTKPAWLTLTDNNDGTATLSGIPANSDVGSHPVRLRVQDAGGLSAEQPFTVTVANVNDAPNFTSTPVTAATEEVPFSYAVTTADPDAGDSRIISALTKPAWLTLTDNADGTATLSGTPAASDIGDHPVTLRVQDDGGLGANQAFIITVNAANNGNDNRAPSFTSTPVIHAVQETHFTYAVTTADPDVGDSRTITAVTNPDWLSLTDNGDGTATLSGTPAVGDIGDNAVTLQVQDNGGLTATQSFTVVVTALPSDAGGLVGQVTAEGTGVPGVIVSVNSDAVMDTVSSATVIAQDITDTSGNYSFGGLAPGPYTLTFAPPSGFDAPDPVDVVVEAGQNKTVQTVDLSATPVDTGDQLFMPNLFK